MALLYSRSNTAGGVITEASDVLFQDETYPQPSWITLSGDQIQFEEPGTPWPIRALYSFDVQFVSASPFTVDAHVYFDASVYTTSIGSFSAGTHTVTITTDAVHDGTGGSGLQPLAIEIHTSPDTTMTVLAGGHCQIHSVEPVDGGPIWSVSILVWGQGGSCYRAATSGDTVAPGGDIGTVPVNFDTNVDGRPWATPGDPITIIPESNAFDSTFANFRIRIRGTISCSEAVHFVVGAYDSGMVLQGSQDSGDIGPGTDIPIDLAFDLNTTLLVGDTYYYNVDLLDPNGGGATLDAGATIEFCYTSIPG